MLAKNAYVQIHMQDKLTQSDIRFQQHSYCNTNINVIVLGYCYNDQVQYSILMYHCVIL